MKRIKWISVVLSLLFISFAVVQYNDPDGWIWMLIYAVPALIFLFQAFGKYHVSIIRIAFYLSLLSLALYIPDFINWIRDRCPSIVGAMKAETPYIEFVREALGLMLVALSLYFFSLRNLKKIS